jgi:hypothetical protein
MSCPHCHRRYCPGIYNATTGEWSCEPAAGADAGIVERRNDFAHYINCISGCSGCGGLGGNMDLAYNGRPVQGFGIGDDFGLSATNSIFASLTSAQQKWVLDALVELNGFIVQQTNTSCSTWPADINTDLASAVKCFQGWYAADRKEPITQDGTLDEMTLCALQNAIMYDEGGNPVGLQRFPDLTGANWFPDPNKQHCQPSGPKQEEKKSNTVYYVVGGVAAAALVGGLIYAGTRRRGAAPA